MAKHKGRCEWIKLFILYNETGKIPQQFLNEVSFSKNPSLSKRKRDRTDKSKERNAERRFMNLYKKWKMDDNLFIMNK